MNADWANFDGVAPTRLPVGRVVGVIYIDAQCMDEADLDAGDDNLHATLCRLAGLPRTSSSSSSMRVKAPQTSYSAPLRLSADTPQLAADLADEYLQLVEAISS